MFRLSKTTAKLAHLALFSELHGEDAVTGVALKLTTTLPSKILDLFEVGLRDSLFNNGTLRFAELGPIRWKREYVGARVGIEADDLLGDRSLKFAEVTVDKFVIEPQNGGSVELTMRAKCKPTPDQMALLFELLGQEVNLTVSPVALVGDKPAANDEQPALIEDAGS